MLSTILYNSSAFAAEGGSQVGVLYGYSVPDADSVNPHTMFGVKGSMNVAANFGIGGYFLDSGESEGTGATSFDYTLHGAEAILNLGGGSGNTFISFRVGLSKVRTTVNGNDCIFSPYHYGFASGYDHALYSWLTVGFEGSFLYVQDSTLFKNGTNNDLDSFGMINFLATLQLKL
jgi:hypothetical protein